MIFSSPIFLFLFVPIFYSIYFLMPAKYKNTVILIASIIFYAWGEPTFVFVALISAYLDFILSKSIYKSNTQKEKKSWLTLSVILNVGLLFYFKYFNFFIENINHFLSLIHFKPLGMLEIALPLAVSFIVFEKITYVTDVYRGVGKPANSLIDYFTYVLLFPKLIAGPIIKYHDIDKQIKERISTKDDIYEGFFRFTKGFFKKVFIADTLAPVIDTIFTYNSLSLGSIDAWLGVICFTIQIYFDFSGYSDMAIGLLRVMGFRIMENFNLPYISKSFTEFWRRWHISLSTFIRDYLYIPLGGNRCSKFRQYFNLFTCFLISGIWHGASWNFIIWGIYHGAFLTVDKALGIKPQSPRKMPAFLQVSITFLLVVISWTIFRSQNIQQIALMLNKMFLPQNLIFTSQYLFSKYVVFILILGFVISFLPAMQIYKNIRNKIDSRFYLKFTLFFILFILTIGKISAVSNITFIYFRF